MKMIGFGGGELPEELAKLLGKLTGDDDEDEVFVREFDAKPEWVAMFNEHQEACQESNRLREKADSIKKLFWATIEKETGLYNNNMKFDVKTHKIKVVANEEDKKKMNAEFFKKKPEDEDKGKKKK